MIGEGLRYIPFYKTDITDRDINDLYNIIKDADNDAYKLINNYENTFANLSGFPFVIAVNTGMYALLLSLKTLGVGEGDEVISPSFSIPEIGEAIEHAGASLAFADIDPNSLTIALDSVKKIINNKTKAIVVFDTTGSYYDLNPIIQMANSNGISVIYYTYYNPLLEYNSLVFPRPHITIFTNNNPLLKGAIIATHMEQTHKLIKSLREHGAKNLESTDLNNDHNNWYYEIVSPGFDCMMNGVQSAASTLCLQKAKEHVEQRIHIAQTYNDLLQPLKHIFLLPVYDTATMHSTWQMYIIRIIKDALTISRNELISELKKKGIETSVHFIPLHIHPYYAKKYKYLYDELINTYEAYISAISLPIYPQLSDDDIKYVVQIITDAVEKFSR